MPALPSLHISVETWRQLPHSYAVVGQFLALHLADASVVATPTGPPSRLVLTIHEPPLYMPQWQREAGLFDPPLEQRLLQLRTTAPGDCPDVVFRAYFPLNLAPWPRSASPALQRTCRPIVYVFGTTEYRIAGPAFLEEPMRHHWRNMAATVFIVPPSAWAAAGFLATGVPQDRLWILPHGIEPTIFRCVCVPLRPCVRACWCGALHADSRVHLP